MIKSLIKKILPSFVISWYHLTLAFLGAVLYCFPSRKIKVVGVTGTNGKTTVVYLITQILEEAGFRTASLSSIKFKIGQKEQPNMLKMTMPGRFKIQRFLRQAVNEGCQYAILEVTSEGIKQFRHYFTNFNTAILTNLSPEHIEAHKGFENYKKAKGKLFRATKTVHIINLDDESVKYFLQFPANKKLTYGLNQGDINQKDIRLDLRLMGDFNIYNGLAAVCFGLSQGIDLNTCKRAVEKIEGIPGRMEQVIFQPFKVFVDYAFTPNALEKVYRTLKPAKGKMVCILGACGGGRDKWKRPILGEIAAKYCERIIITNEDPYDENPLKIIEDVASGFSQIPNSKVQIPKYEKILDRREAVNKALRLAEPGDTVIITGKGSEPWLVEKGGKKTPWDDRKTVKEEYEKIRF